MAKIGTLLAGKYEILTEIGRGGMGVVYLAMDHRLNRNWAIKEVPRTVKGRNNETVVQSLLTETNMMKKLDHPALPRIVDIIETSDTISVVMDYIPGESMDKVLQKEGPQPEETVVDYGKQLCDVLGYLHSRVPPIIYRDMKPSNIMVLDGRLRIIDFGIAREYKAEKSSDTINLGTKGYAAPEQFLRNEQTDARTDIYALGITLYQMVTGKNPNEIIIQKYPIRYWNPSLSAGLESIIQKCTEELPEDRFQSCAELMYALENYKNYGSEHTKAIRKKFNRFIAVLSASVLLLGSGALFARLEKNEAEANYQAAISAAKKETDHDTCLALYERALSYAPTSYEAYQGMVDTSKRDDGAFSLAEEQRLLSLFNANLDGLQASPEEYVDICFNIGKLYWFYYDYGGSILTRTTNAIPWFTDVVDFCDENGLDYSHYGMAQIYRDIGIFNRDYSMNIQEASGSGTYAEYWKNLTALRDYLAADGTEEELVQWEGYRFIVYSLETYMTKFRSDDITREQLETMCNNILGDIERLEATADKTQEIRTYIRERLDLKNGDIWPKIELSYQ